VGNIRHGVWNIQHGLGTVQTSLGNIQTGLGNIHTGLGNVQHGLYSLSANGNTKNIFSYNIWYTLKLHLEIWWIFGNTSSIYLTSYNKLILLTLPFWLCSSGRVHRQFTDWSSISDVIINEVCFL
jgi:hypothetical protein